MSLPDWLTQQDRDAGRPSREMPTLPGRNSIFVSFVAGMVWI